MTGERQLTTPADGTACSLGATVTRELKPGVNRSRAARVSRSRMNGGFWRTTKR